MNKGHSGMGMKKHGKSGCRNGAGKSPRLREALKRNAEANEKKDKSGIDDPKESVSELFGAQKRKDG